MSNLGVLLAGFLIGVGLTGMLGLFALLRQIRSEDVKAIATAVGLLSSAYPVNTYLSNHRLIVTDYTKITRQVTRLSVPLPASNFEPALARIGGDRG